MCLREILRHDLQAFIVDEPNPIDWLLINESRGKCPRVSAAYQNPVRVFVKHGSNCMEVSKRDQFSRVQDHDLLGNSLNLLQNMA